jgi:hypothetical protein
MMATGNDLRSVVRDATEQFLVGDAPALAGELTDALIVVSARIGLLRRSVEARPAPDGSLDEPLDGDLRAIEEAFGRSVDLARRLSQAIRAHRAPGAYASTANIARELGRQLGASIPEPMRLALRCPTGPVLAMIPPSELRRILVVLVRRVVDGVGDGGGELSLEVSEAKTSREARVVVGHPKLQPAAAADAADQARELVHAWGGSVEPCARARGGAAVVVLLPGAC